MWTILFDRVFYAIIWLIFLKYDFEYYSGKLTREYLKTKIRAKNYKK